MSQSDSMFQPIRSELSVPGGDLRKIQKALASDADAVFLDLEDSVAPGQKEAARQVVIDALGQEANYLRNVANFARSATAVLAFCILGIVAAGSLFIKTGLDPYRGQRKWLKISYYRGNLQHSQQYEEGRQVQLR